MHYFPPLLLALNIVIITISVFTENVAYCMISGIVSIFLLRTMRAIRSGSILALLKPDVVILTAIVIYTVPAALDVATGYNSLGLDRTAFQTYLLLILIFTVGIMFGSRGLEKMSPPSQEGWSQIHEERGNTLLAYILIGMGAGLYLIFVIKDFGGFGNLFAATRVDYYREVQGEGVLTAGLNFLRFGWMYLFAIHLSGPNRRIYLVYHLVAIAIFCLFFLFMGERGIWLKLVVGMFFIYAYRFGFSIRWFVIIGVIGILGLQAFSKVRHVFDRPDVTLGEAVQRFTPEWFNLAGGEAGAHFTIANDILLDFETEDLRYGKTYFDGVLNLVPTAIWPDRAKYIITPNVEYMMKYRYWLFKSGTSRAYSFVLETFTNFWYLGTLFIGLLAGWLCKELYQKTLLQNISAQKLALYTSTFGVLMLIVRVSFAGALKNFLLSSIMPFLFLTFCILLMRSRK